MNEKNFKKRKNLKNWKKDTEKQAKFFTIL